VARTKDLLSKLHQETFLLDLARPISGPWQSPYAVRVIDDLTLEVDITKEQGINGMFAELSDRGIEVISMRNKANRLEELFIRIVADGDREAAVDRIASTDEERVRSSADGMPL
jgi:ABC-2 type transport system ATP-binding protein